MFIAKDPKYDANLQKFQTMKIELFQNIANTNTAYVLQKSNFCNQHVLCMWMKGVKK